MFVLNTNILSAIMSARPPSPGVAAWIAGQPGDALFTTTICQAEILAGLAGDLNPCFLTWQCKTPSYIL
jgi:toxin FitB